MRKLLLSVMVLMLVFSGCESISTKTSKEITLTNYEEPATNNDISNKTLDETSAISMVLKNNVDFPSKTSDVLVKKIVTGGPGGNYASVKFTTKVEKKAEGIYIVTLTKDWGFTFNDEYVLSYWKYKVTASGVTLIESKDKDKLPNMMK